ncbi:hypothetical protein DFS34DRAFT_652753 [Phlyctochytrium arcticum]|nr:hypothetical protein DFS34DRAFT_652753 [Phlyctochytrium arcticum]
MDQFNDALNARLERIDEQFERKLEERMAAQFGASQKQKQGNQSVKKASGEKKQAAHPPITPVIAPPTPQHITRIPAQPPAIPAPPAKRNRLPRVNTEQRARIEQAAGQNGTIANGTNSIANQSRGTVPPAPLSKAAASSLTEQNGWVPVPSPKRNVSSRNVAGPENDTRGRPTFADIASRFNDEKTQSDVRAGLLMLEKESKAAIEARQRLRKQHTPEEESKHELKRVYISNFPRLPFGKVKKAMYAFHIRLTQIHNLSWVGNTLEVLIDAHYKPAFLAHLERLQFDVDHSFDPLSDNPASLNGAPRGNAVKHFLQRASDIINRSTKSRTADYFSDWKDEVLARPSSSPSRPPSVPIDLEPDHSSADLEDAEFSE